MTFPYKKKKEKIYKVGKFGHHRSVEFTFDPAQRNDYIVNPFVRNIKSNREEKPEDWGTRLFNSFV